jgi:hypothetical protein
MTTLPKQTELWKLKVISAISKACADQRFGKLLLKATNILVMNCTIRQHLKLDCPIHQLHDHVTHSIVIAMAADKQKLIIERFAAINENLVCFSQNPYGMSENL